MKIFVVVGSNGDYSDRHQWLESWYQDEADAIAERDRLRAKEPSQWGTNRYEIEDVDEGKKNT